ncbi:putative uncharacterized protein DDB_G0277255 [Centruroides sculpturatus]|uniref:putative uncharacterized protein DDB_G0277255 n=1 Tax=Centruroides sculpturatus TaxID=218467 RepID=UPI000C6E5D86|nr:putative uncharacterized protein DDB_G0277255 [Centruroides sculpturatus]
MFKNIKSRRDPMEKAKQHMKVKFSNILSEKELIFNYVNELIAKVENPFVNLLGEDDRVKFLSGYHEVNQELEACLERLLIIQIILNCEQSGKNAEYSDYSNLCSIISSSDSSKKEQQCTWNQNKESNNNNNAPNGILNNRLKSVALDNIELVNADDNSSDLLLNTRLPEVTSNNVSPEITSKTTPETVSEMVANLSEQSDDSTLNTFYQNPVSSELLLTEDVSEFENRNQGDISNGYLETNNCFEYAFMDMNIANDSNNILQKSDSHNSIKSNACISTSGKFSMNSPGINNLFQDIQATDFNFLHLNSENLQNNQNGQDLKNILYSENISDKRNNCDVEDENTQLNFYSKKFLKPITDVPACDVSLNVPLPIDITYVENLRSFWLQPKKKQFEELLNHLQSAEVVKCEYTVSVGQYFLAPYVKDNNLHRVKVLKLLLENNLLVHYIDYGNEGTIPISSLRLLPSSFASIPSQAILCFLEGRNYRNISKIINVVQKRLQGKSVQIVQARKIIMAFQLRAEAEPFLLAYMVEAGFSHVNAILTKQRNRLKLENCGDLRLKLNNFQPHINNLAASLQTHPSH